MFNRILCVAALSSLPVAALAAPQPDVNGDGTVSQADVECLTEVVLWDMAEAPASEYPSCARVRPGALDFNGDRQLSVVDILKLNSYLDRFAEDCSDSPEWGDINGDCVFDESDRDCLIEIALWDGADPYPECAIVDPEAADLNGSGAVNVADVMLFITSFL